MAKNKDILKYALENDIDVDIAYEVINNFFLYFREYLGSETFPDIRIKKLGLFTPAISRIKNNIRNLDNLYKKGGISKDKYKLKKELLVNYLKQYEKS
tara:strand:- start:11732 stop:12025 length:294 start_codon:yes stop_codon:yes gene_type:complete